MLHRTCSLCRWSLGSVVCARRPASSVCWDLGEGGRGTSSSSAEVLAPSRPTGLMGGVTSCAGSRLWLGLVRISAVHGCDWRWTRAPHCQHHGDQTPYRGAAQGQPEWYHYSPAVQSYGCRLEICTADLQPTPSAVHCRSLQPWLCVPDEQRYHSTSGNSGSAPFMRHVRRGRLSLL